MKIYLIVRWSRPTSGHGETRALCELASYSDLKGEFLFPAFSTREGAQAAINQEQFRGSMEVREMEVFE